MRKDCSEKLEAVGDLYKPEKEGLVKMSISKHVKHMNDRNEN